MSSSSSSGATSGRSPEAAQIFVQYGDYSSQLDARIHAIDCLPYEQRQHETARQSRDKIILLKTLLFKSFAAHYSDSTATAEKFKKSFEEIDQRPTAAFTKALGKEEAKKEASEAAPSNAVEAPQSVQKVAKAAPNGPLRVESGTWYIDWTSWNLPIPQHVNTVNIFVGCIRLDEKSAPVVDGFDCMFQEGSYKVMDGFVKKCHDAGIIDVKISIGGNGGRHDKCWNVLTKENILSFAKTLTDFCHAHGLNGVDFDYENDEATKDKPEQHMLVGALIKEFKKLDPSLQTSLCTNAGFGPNFPWQTVVDNIFQASQTEDRASSVDRLYIMSYYEPLENEKTWVDGWANWLKEKYKFTPSQVTVGINNTDSKAYDIELFARWAKEKGYSSAYWSWDPLREAHANDSCSKILKV